MLRVHIWEQASHTENVRSDEFAIFLLVMPSTNKVRGNRKLRRTTDFFRVDSHIAIPTRNNSEPLNCRCCFPLPCVLTPDRLSQTHLKYQVSNDEIVKCYHWTTLKLIWVTQAGVVVVVIDTCLPYHFCASNTRRPPPPFACSFCVRSFLWNYCFLWT